MISLDTNVLVRIIVKDDDAQVDLARRLVKLMKDENERCLVTIAVLCELQWVLARVYKASREELTAVVEMLLNDGVFVLEDTELVQEALKRFRSGKADLPDFLIGGKSLSLGATSTYTFDNALRHENGFSILEESTL
jgi:predicted nucleic-acid-binding protein